MTIGAIIPIVPLIQSRFKLMGLFLPSLGLISPYFMSYCLLFHFLGLSMHVFMVIGFEVDVVEVEEVEEVAVLIALWLGFGVEWGDVK